MSKKRILSVEFRSPLESVEYVAFTSKLSLLEGDIIIFNPDISYFTLFASDIYQGKPSLNESRSFQLLECFEHWRRELLDAFNAGKTIFVFLNAKQEVFIDTGRRDYSGTGRNRETTVIVNEYDNYRCIPFTMQPVNSKGSAMKLAKGTDIISSYWSDFSEHSEYRVRLEGDFDLPLVLTKHGEKVLGAHLRGKQGGNLILLPFLDFNLKKYFEEDETNEDDFKWTPKALSLGRKLFKHITEIVKFVAQESQITPAPEWVSDSKYTLKKEKLLHNKLLLIEKKFETLSKEKEKQLTEMNAAIIPKRILYEKGKPLENAILETLKLMGFETYHYRESDSEFDVIFQSKEGRFLGEVEGKDKRAINIDKLRQLKMNIHEDFSREDVNEIAQGVLFGNAYRLTKPDDRGDFFTAKCLTAAKRDGIALIRTPDLFPVTKYLLDNKNKRFAMKCRKAILQTKGEIVVFPPIPIDITDTKRPSLSKKIS